MQAGERTEAEGIMQSAAQKLLRQLFDACPTKVSCPSMHHNEADYHLAVEACKPLMRYKKALKDVGDYYGIS